MTHRLDGSLRVAAAQAESVSGDVEANVRSAVALVDSAVHRGAQVVVLPELFLTGYDPAAFDDAHAIELDDPRLTPLAEARPQALVLAGAAVRESGAPRLVLLAFHRGQVRLAYRKQHLFSDEAGYFVPGDTGASVDFEGWRLGLGICYDGCFPEHARAAAVAGATAYLCPAAYVVGSEHRRDLYYPARALDNGMYVVFAGLVGRCGDHAYSGGSAVFDPEGQVVDRVGTDSPAMVVVDLDPELVRRTRERHPMLRDHRTDLARHERVVLA